MKVPFFFDLVSTFISLEKKIHSALSEVFKTQQFILGPQVKALEQAISQYSETPHAVGVASGSDALLLSLMALGIEAGDEVLLPPFTFFARRRHPKRLKRPEGFREENCQSLGRIQIPDDRFFNPPSAISHSK